MDSKINFKKILIISVAFIYIITVAVAVLVYCYDPFFHFHKPLSKLKYSVENESYQNPGIARNFDYDSLIVGSSMTQLLRPSIFDEDYDCKVVKVSYSGATCKNNNIIVNQAFDYHNGNIKNIFWGLDMYALDSDIDSIKQPIPDYLYDNNVFNDLSYLLNKDVIYEIVDVCRNGGEIDYDAMYTDMENDLFSQQTALSYWEKPKFISRNNIENIDELSPSENVVKNMEYNILPIVKENSDTKFIFFIPPYPIIRWGVYLDGGMPQLLADLKYISDSLDEYENSEFHMLPLMDGTDNMYLYKDTYHYNPVIGDKVSKALVSKDYLVTSENVTSVLRKLDEYATDYDYSIFTGEKYPFQNITGFESYLDSISSLDYTEVIYLKDNCLEDAEIDLLKQMAMLPDEYSNGEYFAVLHPICGGFEKADAEGIILNDSYIYVNDINYTPEEKNFWIVIYDSESGRVVDVAGFRDDTREFVKY